ncbi:MAG: alkaline phosphatase family protein [Roseiarcus sp.]|uniref:alkaline phosphatase family protein n=1 Tax=Roseiarcus sp. TaxID=1969460 RepID=UPI003BB0E3D4
MSKTIGVSLFALVIASSAHAQQIGDVFYIALENHNFTQPGGPGTGSPQQLFGNAAAPYLNSLVTPGNPNAAQVSYASNYVNVFQGGTAVHPSEPNYVWMESGMAGPPPSGPWNDNDPYPNNIVNAPNLSNLLQNKYGTSGWRSYQEDIDLATNSMGQLTNTVLPKDQWTVPLNSLSGTSPAYTNAYNGSDQYNYAAKHDPQVFFTATNGGNNTTPSNPEAKYYAPLQQLQTDLNNNTVARYNWITPDQYNEMHSSLNTDFTYNGVTYMHNTDQEAVALGDNFLSIIVPEIEASQAYKDNGEIVIWNDETEGGNGPGYTSTEIIISPLAKGNAYTNDIAYNHSSDLATLQHIFGVGGDALFLGGAAGANTLSDLYLPGAIPNGVPEPSTWAMMLAGFAGLAAAGYRRKAGSAARPALG